MRETVLDGIVAALRAALAYDRNVQEGPVALLWPDERSQWAAVADRIGGRLPLVCLGPYDPASRRGPAYWIRCVVAGSVDAGLPEGPPVVYLPGVSRGALRASDDCPPELAPIAELQYRSQWFSHPNGKDWSLRALLSHRERGLGLRIADDAQTREALEVALRRLVDERLDRLRRQHVDAAYLHHLVNPDPVLSLLEWLDDPAGFRDRSEAEEWSAFLQRCRNDFEFDPLGEGEVTAARRLAGRASPWQAAWKRFAETPDRFPGLPERLRGAKPQELIFDPEVWPQDNDVAEEDLRRGLLALAELTPREARAEVERLETEHSKRRGTVWADLDRAPLAFALEQLGSLAKETKRPLEGRDLASLVAGYAERGWRADDAVLRALAAAPGDRDRAAVSAAIAALYREWVDVGARALQAAIGSLGDGPPYEAGPPAATAAGTVSVFVDGLRLDVGQRLREALESAGVQVRAGTALAALPTVTQTAKAALVPVADGALGPGEGLHAVAASTGAEASAKAMRALMAANGVQVLGPGEAGDPSGTAFAEIGEIDRRGHDDGLELADRVDEEVRRIAARVRDLLEAGWERIEVVTDHGWMLVPGGMEKVTLPAQTALLKKGRCARLKEGAAVEVPTVPWHWDREVRIALAPGASCFEANKEYEHGGVSPQECVVPRLAASVGATAPTEGPELTGVKWLGLHCRVEFAGVAAATLDLRRLPGDPGSSLAEEAKEVASAGKVSLLVPDEDEEGEAAFLVLVAPDGRIVAQRETTVGSNR
ncbi:MAG: BREX-1 system phosphatase PglZ type B [Solirubrobacterales bacterium]